MRGQNKQQFILAKIMPFGKQYSMGPMSRVAKHLRKMKIDDILKQRTEHIRFMLETAKQDIAREGVKR